MKTPNINTILRERTRSSKYGAPMGSSNYFDTDEETKCYLQKINFIDGDYSADGTYWGKSKSENLYCAFNEVSRVYIRAKSRASAKAKLIIDYPEITFYKG